MLKVLLFCFILNLPLASNPTSDSGILTIKVENIKSKEGMLWLGIYKSQEDFLNKEKAILVGLEVENEGNMEIKVPDLAYGEYAFALFHDENNMGKWIAIWLVFLVSPFLFPN